MCARRLDTIFFCQKVPSCTAEVESLCLRIRGMLRASGLLGLCFTVELLARECLANALDHGNRWNVDKSMLLRLRVGWKWIRLEVVDQGSGFAWRKARRNRLYQSAPSGRGLQLYALYTGRIQFNRRGNQITLWIRTK